MIVIVHWIRWTIDMERTVSIRMLMNKLKAERDEKKRQQRLYEGTIKYEEQLSKWNTKHGYERAVAGRILRVRTYIEAVNEYRIDVLFKKDK